MARGHHAANRQKAEDARVKGRVQRAGRQREAEARLGRALTDEECFCGCGGVAPVAKGTKVSAGLVKGDPAPYVAGHGSKGRSLGEGPDYVIENDCWVWQRARSSNGYGNLNRDGKWIVAHRWYYEQHAGPIPEGLDLDHLCRNRACVNPDHLEPVTRAVNIQRGVLARASV